MAELAFPTQQDNDDAEYEGHKKRRKGNGFQSLGLSKHVFGGVMRMGYKVPTPIQRKTLPLVLAGRDVVAMARTGAVLYLALRPNSANPSIYRPSLCFTSDETCAVILSCCRRRVRQNGCFFDSDA